MIKILIDFDIKLERASLVAQPIDTYVYTYSVKFTHQPVK